MVKKLNPKQHRDIQLAALEVIDAVNTMRDRNKEGPFFGPFVVDHNIKEWLTPQRRSIKWPELEQAVQQLQRAIDELPRQGRKSKNEHSFETDGEYNRYPPPDCHRSNE